MKFKIISIIIIFIIIFYYYFIPIATEHKSHGNLIIPDIQTRGYFEYYLNLCEIYEIQHLDYTGLTAEPNLFA